MYQLIRQCRDDDGLRQSFSQLADAYASLGSQVPIFSIMFGDADESQLESLAEFSNARVFDGREDLVGAFRSVKGYN